MAELLDELGYPTEVTKSEVVSAFLQTIQRTLNCLSADEQKSRRDALEKLQVCLLKDDGSGSLPPMDVLQAAWDEVILEKALQCVADPIEKCRELSIQLIRGVAQSLIEVDWTLKETVRVMSERMGQVPVLEDSEEIRFQLLSLLIDVLLPQCELPTLKTTVDALHRIVALTLYDQFHEVQKKACTVLIITANRDPEVFGNKTGAFLKGLIPCLSHTHSRVRIAVFQAIDALMQCGLTQRLVAQQLGPGTKSLAFDHSTTVRELFFSSVANWLNYKVSLMSDEEAHQCVVSGKIPRFHVPELLPLLLLGITDDCIDIAVSTYEKLEAIGRIYKRFIDELDIRVTHDNAGKPFRTPEEDAAIMEKVLDQDRKCEERHQRELREVEEERRLECQRERVKREREWITNLNELESESTSAHVLTENNSIKEISTANTGDRSLELRGKVVQNEDETKVLHLEKNTQELKLENCEQSPAPEESVSIINLYPREYSDMIVDQAIMQEDRKFNVDEGETNENEIRAEANSTGNEAMKRDEENTMAGENIGVHGLHILTNQELRREFSKYSQGEVRMRATSEITDEGAVQKQDEAGVETLHLPKPYQGRPGAGCRLMVEAFLRPMIEPALLELKQWTAPTRLSAARYLHTLMVMGEGLAKDNLDILIPAFCSAVGDDDVRVAKRVVATIHIVGFHVPPRKWLPLTLKHLGNAKASRAQKANVLVVMAAFLYGTPGKAIEEKHIAKICDKLYDKDVSCCDHLAVQNQLLSVVTNLIQVAGALCKTSTFKIFVLLLQVQSVDGDTRLQKRSGQVLEDLAHALGMESARELYVQYVHNVLDIVTADHEGWSSGLQGKLMFQTFMRSANDAVGPHLESLLPLFNACLQPDQDPGLRIGFLQLLDELFETPGLESSWRSLAVTIIGKILTPCAVWRASKTEAAVRYGAMVALGTFLRKDMCSQVHMEEIMKLPEGFLPVIKNCLDEDYFLDVRRATTHVMYQFLRVGGLILSDEERSKIIKLLSKRMDDSSNIIRRCILPAVEMFFTTMPFSFSDSEVKDFLLLLVVHMDDENPQIQEGVCKAMQACALKKPKIVKEVSCGACGHRKNPLCHVYRVLNVVCDHLQPSSSPDQISSEQLQD
ncbi:uncharacterized protein [Physcomitrium patens]|uniref:uncharacterized protein isoform X1 n=2 Tax=Physcomitrium patens TaxID=3218 RepID=UPI000D179950|nr:dynein assembly factor 5, axonemal-like isoform X2 [Physcomitrium patens]|eukprot:XP_024357132.1 dynein assembly factor 5, axonemal-like isoform X2 [Physcomitrella patens]